MGKFSNNVDEQYFGLLAKIIEFGCEKESRAGKTKSYFGASMRFDLREGFPLLTTKKMYYKGIIHELLWFIHGDTNIKYLVDNSVNIWTDDAYRFYLERVKKSNEILESIKMKISENSTQQERDIDSIIRKIYQEDETDDKCIYAFAKKITPVSKEEFVELVKKEEKIPIIDRSEENLNCTLKLYTYGDLGPIYGKQWRSYGVSGYDQIKHIIDMLKENPDDRRMIINAWNPDVFDEIALPACHSFAQFYSYDLSFGERIRYLDKIDEEEKYAEWKSPSAEKLDELGVPRKGLKCYFYCRSQDVPLGTPYNIASYALLTSMIAQCAGMAATELIYSGGDCHIYLNQMDGIKEQLERNPHQYPLPKLWLNPAINSIDSFKYEDIKIEGYESYPQIKFELNVGLKKENNSN